VSGPQAQRSPEPLLIALGEDQSFSLGGGVHGGFRKPEEQPTHDTTALLKPPLLATCKKRKIHLLLNRMKLSNFAGVN